MKELKKWFVAQTYINKAGASVSYLSYQDGPYGLHWSTDINDPCVIWFDSREEALKHKVEDEITIHFAFRTA